MSLTLVIRDVTSQIRIASKICVLSFFFFELHGEGINFICLESHSDDIASPLHHYNDIKLRLFNTFLWYFNELFDKKENPFGNWYITWTCLLCVCCVKTWLLQCKAVVNYQLLQSSLGSVISSLRHCFSMAKGRNFNLDNEKERVRFHWWKYHPVEVAALRVLPQLLPLASQLSGDSNIAKLHTAAYSLCNPVCMGALTHLTFISFSTTFMQSVAVGFHEFDLCGYFLRLSLHPNCTSFYRIYTRFCGFVVF